MVRIWAVVMCVAAVATAGPLESDEHTAGLWRLDSVSGAVVADLSGRGRDGAITGEARAADGALEVNANGALQAPKGGEAILAGPFTVDVDLQVTRSCGKFFAAGTQRQLVWGLLLRGAGIMQLRMPIATAEGKFDTLTAETYQFQKPIGPFRYDTVHRMTLTFDGQRHFTAYVDGTEVFSADLPEGAKLAVDEPVVSFGYVGAWNSNFVARLLCARVSDIARVQQASPRFLPTSLSEAAGCYRFDMGGDDTLVETGCLAVTPSTPYTTARGFGWTATPIEAVDYWFSPGRYSPSAEASEKGHFEAVRSWRDRDALRMPSGSVFRADLPAGRYAVSVTFGDLRKNTRVAAIEANGVSLSDDLRMYEGKDKPTYAMTIAGGRTGSINRTDRTARGMVEVGSDGLQVTVRGVEDEPVGVLAIEASPWAPPVIGKVAGERKLVWQGDGPAPAQFAAFADAYASKQFDEAVQLAEKLADPTARATAWAWVLGYPNATDGRHVQLAERITQALAGVEGVRAEGLRDITRLMYMVLRIQTDDTSGLDDLVGSTNWRHLRSGVDIALRIRPEEPYYGRARLLAGSFIYQQVQQNGAMIDAWTPRKPEGAVGWPPPVVYFLDAAAMYPDSTLTRIYLGEKVAIEKQIPIPPGAPRWAALQHRVTVRVMDVIHYWTDQRQQPNGALGGGIGDDVETLRWWSIGDLVTDDERTREGWRKIADQAYRYTRGYGCTTDFADVEHGAEPFSDTHTFLPFIEFGTDRFEAALKRQHKGVFKPMLDTWTAVNPQGYRMFRSYYYSATEVQDRNGDVPYNLRTANPLLTYLWFTRDKETADLIVAWARSWRDAILAEGEGKPAGIVPMIVTFDKRKFKWDTSKNWYDPGYFNYPAGFSGNIYNLLLAAYEVSGDESYLEPVRKAMAMLRDVEPPSGFDPAAHYYVLTDQALGESGIEKGTLRWALWFGQRALADAGARYRIATGDGQFDDVLMKYGLATTKSRLAFARASGASERSAAMEPICAELAGILDEMDYNNELRTSEPKSTDRVWVGGTEQVISMATGTESAGGARGAERQWPLFAVSWKGTGEDVAVWTTVNERDRVAGYVYSFADAPRQLGAELWRLTGGDYSVTVQASDGFAPGAALEQSSAAVAARGDVVSFTAPPLQEVFFDIKRK